MNYSICVSGAASGKTVDASHGLAERVGRAIAKEGHTITTGATVGLPFYAARAAKRAGGMSIGFSPAGSLREHVSKYRLPIGMFDFINFTGQHYIGRDLSLILSSDAIISIGGRFGTLNEFTIALESQTPIGVLLGSGGTADLIPELLTKLEPVHKEMILMDDDPERLVQKIVHMLDRDLGDIDTHEISNSWFLEGRSQIHSSPKS
jgi:uncharacterized protein (TIGR00725 family)